MKYVNNSADQMYVTFHGQSQLISPGQEIESSEAIKCVGLSLVLEKVKKPKKVVPEVRDAKKPEEKITVAKETKSS